LNKLLFNLQINRFEVAIEALEYLNSMVQS